MPWPKSTDYIEAVQNLHQSMDDEELSAGQLTLTPLGLPMVWSGGFADVYKIHNATTGNSWALKCFTKKVAGQAERYQHISNHLKRARLPFMVDFTYLDRGIRVRGEWYPALKMHWVEGGIRLNEFVEQYLDRPRTLRELLRIWVKMADGLRQAAVGHCDLQHGNVLMVPRDGGSLALRLIDYDGIHVPALAGARSPELGHPAFQHPQRSSDRIYSAEVDRFSHLAIYTSIHCLTVGREELWNRFNNSDNLLFREGDFRSPGTSDVFRTLWKLPDTDSRALVGRLALACEKPLDQVPLLDEVANDKVCPLTQAEEQEVESLLGSAPTSQPVAVATDVPLVEPLPETTPRRRNPWQLSLAFLRALDGPLKKIAGEENEILHNFLRIMAAVVLVMLIVVGTRMVPQWIENAGHSGAEAEVADSIPAEATASPDPADSPPVAADLPDDYTNAIGMQFKLIPAGEFMMGSAEDDSGKEDDKTPQHRVQITTPFYMGIHEVTQEQYEEVVGETPSHFKGPSLPVECVSWDDASEFCIKLSEMDTANDYRLPTEAEWEYACRAGTTTKFSHGDNLSPDHSWYGSNSDGKTHPVGEKCANPWGLYDMHGNVWEWCADWYDPKYYGTTPFDAPKGPTTGSHRVDRGGCYRYHGGNCSSANRSRLKPDTRISVLGFRVVAIPTDSQQLSESPDVNLKLRHVLKGPRGDVHRGAFSPDGQWLVVPCYYPNSGATIWNVETGERVRTVAKNPKIAMLTASFSPDGTLVAAGGDARLLDAEGKDNLIHLCDAITGASLFELHGHKKNIWSVVFTPDQKRLISASTDRTIRIWNLESRELESTLTGHATPLRSLAVSPDGALLASSGQDGIAKLWDLSKETVIATLACGSPGTKGFLEFSPNGRELAVNTRDEQGRAELVLWDVASRKERWRILTGQEWNHGITFSPDGRMIACGGSSHRVMLWDASSGNPLGDYAGHSDAVLSVLFSPDGKTLASGGADDTVRIWNVETAADGHPSTPRRQSDTPPNSSSRESVNNAQAAEIKQLGSAVTSENCHLCPNAFHLLAPIPPHSKSARCHWRVASAFLLGGCRPVLRS